ncbi:MAG: hypothetical protein ACFFD2_01290 [Promethearchaeota archaeon]
MKDEELPKKEKKEGQTDSSYSNILDTADSALLNEENSSKTGKIQKNARDTHAIRNSVQMLFPPAPDLNDPNIYPDFQGAKVYYNTRNYDKAVDTIINIFRYADRPTDQNMASELVLEMAKTIPKALYPLLPYLIILEKSEDPIIKMNINNALTYLREDYNTIITQLKESIKSFIVAYYSKQNTSYIPFAKILTAIGTSLEVIIKILERQIKNREITGKLDFINQVFAYEPPDVLFLCPHCGIELKKDAKFCTSCQKDVFKCSICFNFIKNEELVKCTKCDAPAHEQHLLEWVKKTGKCPVCQENLYEQEVAKVTCVVCGLRIKSDEKTEKLIKCPQCGTLAHKEHYLDYLKISQACPKCKKPFSQREIKEMKKMKK